VCIELFPLTPPSPSYADVRRAVDAQDTITAEFLHSVTVADVRRATADLKSLVRPAHLDSYHLSVWSHDSL